MSESIRFTEKGEEICHGIPIEIPLDFKRPLTLQEEIRRMIAVEASRAAEDAGLESFEEADDFNVEDEDEPFSSPYEVLEMYPDGPSEEPGGSPDVADRAEEAATPRDDAKGSPAGEGAAVGGEPGAGAGPRD